MSPSAAAAANPASGGKSRVEEFWGIMLTRRSANRTAPGGV